MPTSTATRSLSVRLTRYLLIRAQLNLLLPKPTGIAAEHAYLHHLRWHPLLSCSWPCRTRALAHWQSRARGPAVTRAYSLRRMMPRCSSPRATSAPPQMICSRSSTHSTHWTRLSSTTSTTSLWSTVKVLSDHGIRRRPLGGMFAMQSSNASSRQSDNDA